MLPIPIDFESLQWESPLPGARFKAYRHGGKQLRLLEFSAEFVEPDCCEKGHVGFVLEGTLEVDFNGRGWSIRKALASSFLVAPQPHIRRDPLRQLYGWCSSKMCNPSQLPVSVSSSLINKH